MKICIVCSGNFKNDRIDIYQTAIYEQVKELENLGNDVFLFLIKGKGIKGYLKNRKRLICFLNDNKFDVIHAHSGLSGLLLSISTNKKFAITFHGSDINKPKERFLSILPSLRSEVCFFVSDNLLKKVIQKSFIKSKIIPCGIDLNIFFPIDKIKARNKLQIDLNLKIILFSSSFDNKVKNAKISFQAINSLNFNVLFLEIKDKNREEINYMLNASDVLLLTSHTEGSPQIVKEALACNKPIISVDVGDVKQRLEKVRNCYIVEKNPKKISEILTDFFNGKDYSSNGRDSIKELSNIVQVKKLNNYYEQFFN